jgi:predicted nucleic acid-binding protein
MPTINKQFELTITPEQFLNACSVNELKELDMLIQSPRYQEKITADERQLKLDAFTSQTESNES